MSHAPSRNAVSTGAHAWWGISTASYQNEDRGALPGQPGYFTTDWDLFADAGRVPRRGEKAANLWSGFHNYVRLLRELGVTHFRFSVEWARVEPRPGVFDEKAIARYASMARELREAGIEPVVTLWHFTFPSWLYHPGRRDRSNFLDPLIIPGWNRYVTVMVKALRPHVHIYVPENEPNADLQLAYIAGRWPPGFTMAMSRYRQAMDVAVEMFRNAATIIRQEAPDSLVMSVHAIPYWRKNRIQDPTGAVYNAMLRLDFDHLDRVYDTCDLIGVNYYFAQDASLIRFLYPVHGEEGMKYTQLGWEIDPEGFHHVLSTVYARYGKPIVVTENGLATVSEEKKLRYLRQHVNQMRRAAADGVDIRGYFVWTLVDNYEWQEGWDASFGIGYTDPRTGGLIMAPSGAWYRDFIRMHPDF